MGASFAAFGMGDGDGIASQMQHQAALQTPLSPLLCQVSPPHPLCRQVKGWSPLFSTKNTFTHRKSQIGYKEAGRREGKTQQLLGLGGNKGNEEFTGGSDQ